MTQIITLENGLRVIAVPMRQRKSVSIGIWAHAGSRDETPEISGISHFLEHLLFKGTATRTANQIKEAVEGIGGSFNAFTGEEYTCYLAKCSSRHFDSVFDVLADMVLNASLNPADIEKERGVIMEEIKMAQDQPGQLAEEILSELVWAGHPLGRPIAGTLETVGRMTAEDIRDYKRRFYSANFLTIVVAGDIQEKKLVNAVKERFVGMKEQSDKKPDLFKVRQNGVALRIFEKSTEQTHLAFALHAFGKNHEDETALDLLSVALGGNMSSRLFNEVREERGLAYEIGSSVRKYHETGAFGVDAGVDNKKLSEAVGVILAELDKVRQKPIGEDELKRAKEFYIGQLELSLENTMNQMLWAGENAICIGRLKDLPEVMRHVNAVTTADLQKVAQTVFRSDRLNLAIVGPHSDALRAKLEKMLYCL